MASNTLRQAEKRALDGANESQDTLLVAHYLMMDYAIGLRSSSPAAAEAMPPPSPKRSRPSSRGGDGDNVNLPGSTVVADTVSFLARSGLSPVMTANATPASNIMDRADQPCQTRGTCVVDSSEQSQASSIPETQDVGYQEADPPADRPTDWGAANQDGVVGDLNLSDTLPASAEIDSTSRRKKMDSTQASTQSNVGRSYDQYRRPLSPGHTSPNPSAPHSPIPFACSSPGRGSFDREHDNGTHLDIPTVAGTNNTVSPGQDDSGFVDFGNLARFRHVTTQNTAQSPTSYLPETPDPPQNPFRNSRSQLLPTSQLFRGTQFSSPVKLASPTSSRPSPADFLGNSISPNPIISSPLKARGLRSSPAVDVTSSPDVLPGTTSSKLNGRASSPVNATSTADPVVPESSHDGPTRKRSGPDPMTTYEPMRKSQERRATSEVRTDPISSGEEDDGCESIVRWRKAKSKKAAALKQLTAISFPRPSRTNEVEVPSTSQRRRASQAEAYIAQCLGKNPATQDLEIPEAAEECRECPALPVRDPPVDDEESTQSGAEEEVAPVAEPNSSTVPELPRSSTKSASQLAQAAGIDVMSNGEAIPETSPTSGRVGPLPKAVPPPVASAPTQAKSTPNFQSSPPAFSTRSRKIKKKDGISQVPSPTSSLSNLASTPQLPPGKTTAVPNPAPASSPTESTIVASSSPVVAQTKRRGTRGRLPNIKTSSTESLRQSARATRRGSNSTDELTKSVSGTPTFEQSLRVSRLSVSRSASRAGRGAMKPPPTQKDVKLFDNMAFAISFQSRKPGETNDQYSTRVNFSTTVQKRIKQAGGRILENGFDELFEVSPMGTPSSSPTSTSGAGNAIGLTPDGRATGFTALIADGHSRKVKYMQALALGLPCIAARWVTACLDRNELVDWTPYLLCAGQSAFLGDAIRSRILPPYEASTAKLPDVISQRAKLLEGSRILAVVKKALEEKKMAYVFLARVLGASLKRVYTVDEAKVEMKAAEDKGEPFDWVYVDGKVDEDALFGTGPAPAKKRKRASAAAGSSVVQPPVKRVRTLSDELVIQSLILGRLIEEGEMDV